MERGSRIEVRTGTILAGAVALLILPLSLLLSFVMAGVFHEFCHWLVLRWAGVNIYTMSIGPYGASIETEPMDPDREVLCALAGPAGSFLLVAFYRILPEMALCALLQGMFNLLPLYPLDGGRILKGTLEILKIPGREMIFTAVQYLALLAVCGLSLYGFLKWNLGYGVLFLGAALVLRTFPRKIPCKEAFFGVQ